MSGFSWIPELETREPEAQDTESAPGHDPDPDPGEEGGASHAGINGASIGTTITSQMCSPRRLTWRGGRTSKSSQFTVCMRLGAPGGFMASKVLKCQ